MKERGILMSEPMVKAYLAGRKTQTRRIVKSQPTAGDWEVVLKHDGWHFKMPEAEQPTRHALPCPYGAAGDSLWFREAWRVAKKYDGLKPRDIPFDRGLTIMYEAGGSRAHDDNHQYVNDDTYPPSRPDWAGKYRHARFLPRVAARIVVELTEIRVQRLLEITEEDALEEGVEHNVLLGKKCYIGAKNVYFTNARSAYLSIWDSINGEGAAARNDWVWALTFPKYEG